MGGIMNEGIRFYCGIGEKQWNWWPVAPGPDACISPVYGNSTASKEINSVRVPEGVQVIQDSGAFSDGPGQRLNFADALKRQERHAERYGYTEQIEARASMISSSMRCGTRPRAVARCTGVRNGAGARRRPNLLCKRRLRRRASSLRIATACLASSLLRASHRNSTGAARRKLCRSCRTETCSG